MSNENPNVIDKMTDSDKEQIESAVRAASPAHGEILDQINGLKERVRVLDKRRFADRINDEDMIDQIRRADPEAQSVSPMRELTEHLAAQFSPSSTPSDKPGMDFPTAIKQVMKGHRVTRLEWENPEIWLMMFYWGAISPKQPAGKYLSIHHADGAVNPLVIGDGDLLGDDWVVVV